MTYKDNCFLARYFFKTCKVRRLATVGGVIICSIFFIRIVMYRYFDFRGDGTNDYLSGGAGFGNRKHPKDFPGYFMKGKHPSKNISYCNFNYGLPHKLDWSQITVTGTPQLGKNSPYRVIYDAIERTMFQKPYVLEQVTYATHITPEYLYHVVEISRFWDGPISVAAFVPDYDLDITMRLFDQLCRCYDGMSKVSVHLVFPRHDRPRFLRRDEHSVVDKMKRIKVKIPELLTEEPKVETTEDPLRNFTNSINETVRNVTVAPPHKKVNTSALVLMDLRRKERRLMLWFQDCSMPDMTEVKTYRSRYGLIYPVNVGRNVARNATSTQYNLVSDVEMIPSEGLATRFMVMIKKQKINGHYGVIPKWRLAFVIPVFEVESGEDVPRNKSSLQQLYAEGKAVYFHRWVCSHCQKIPDLQNWIKEDPGKVIKPFAITKRQFPYHRWEPIYIGTKHAPWYSETLSWEGRQDKMTQMLEMCLKSYDFVIVNGAFLCHSPGIKSKSKKRSWRYRHELVNTKQYDLIVKNLAERYPVNPKCRLE